MLIKCMKYIVRHIYATLVVQPPSIQATGLPFHFVESKWQKQISTIWTAPQTMQWPHSDGPSVE